ncbi:MAG: GNAT family N-acetyltransferase, partial [Desulfovibrionaceae bacterium]|nr:GNAT family N-acetyltransferase [Desulfovibrionaceae bacterium]
MHFERITTPDHPLYAGAIALYRASFPPHEQRETASQTAILSHPAYHFDAVLDGEAFVGEVLSWDIGPFRYLEHFCILSAMRNRGYGKKILAALRDRP